MKEAQPKKKLIINILDILKKNTDFDHRLSQKDLVDILDKEYGMKVERKSIRRNIIDLIEYGYEIEYTESVRMVPNKKTGVPEESYIWSDFYLVRDFTDSELRLLIDSLLFSKHIPYNQCRELVEKLEGLSNKYFRSHVRHIHTMPDTQPQNKQLFLTIEVLDNAISSGKQVAFSYLEYGTDKKQHKRRREDGSVREYIINPYQMAAKEGRYYLICNHDKYDTLANYRIDRITDIRLLDTPVKPFKSLPGAKDDTLDLAEYMKRHIYMYSSGDCRVRFRIKKAMISNVIDMFGMDVDLSDETDDCVCVSATVNELAMRQFAINYAPDVILLEPEYLSLQIRQNAEATVREYDKINTDASR